MNLEKRLNRWSSAGLLTEEQAAKILVFEHEQPSASWVLYGITGLGATVLMTGIISIIAANWDVMSPATKLIGYFVSLIGLGYAAWRRLGVEGVVRECLITLFALYVLAGIGLIGQVYNLTSNGYEGLFLWLALILPTALMAQSRLVNHLWFVGLIIAVVVWWSTSFVDDDYRVRRDVSLALCYISLAVGYLLWSRFSYFSSAARMWGFAVLLLVFGTIGNIAWSWGESIKLFKQVSSASSFAPLGGLLAAAGAVLWRRPSLGNGVTSAILVTLLFTALLIFPPLYGVVGEHRVVGCALFVAAWSGAAAIAAAMERKRLFDFAALVIAIRFIVVYFEVFSSLAATGVGLILSGGIILGVAYIWYRYRGAVARAIREGL